jgi:hypothetical protein
MAANRNEVDEWIDTARKDKMKFIISVCDTYDWEDYPVYCKDKKELLEVYNNYDRVNMQKINEIIQVEENSVTEKLSIHNIQNSI